MKGAYIFVGLLVAWTSQAQEVKLYLNGAIDIYQFEPKLERVLSRHAQQANWYGPASTLYKRYNESVELERTQILAKLQQLQDISSDEHTKLAIGSLYEQITRWQLVTKLDVPLDFDLVRLHERYNPRVTFGEYYLNLRNRPVTVNHFGMSDTGEQKHLEASDASMYIDQINYSKAADYDFVFIIPLNGEVQKVSVAYWDNEHTEVPPGSTLYVPIKENLFSDTNELNERIAQLARNRLQ